MIKFMKGETFNRLKNLEFVALSDNNCINQDFSGKIKIAVLSQIVTEKCATNWIEIVQTLKTSLSTTLQDKMTCMSDLADVLDQIKLKKIEIDQKNEEIKDLENERILKLENCNV